jgi:hypothetical protein
VEVKEQESDEENAEKVSKRLRLPGESFVIRSGF